MVINKTYNSSYSNHLEIRAIHEESQECVWLRFVIQYTQESYGLSSIKDNLTMLHDINIACIAQIKEWCIQGDGTKFITLKFIYTFKL